MKRIDVLRNEYHEQEIKAFKVESQIANMFELQKKIKIIKGTSNLETEQLYNTFMKGLLQAFIKIDSHKYFLENGLITVVISYQENGLKEGTTENEYNAAKALYEKENDKKEEIKRNLDHLGFVKV